MQFVDRGPLTIVGIRVVAPFRELWTKVPEAWRSLRARSGEIPYHGGGAFIDVSLEEDAGTYTQVVGAEVSALADAPEGMVAVELPPRRYIHYRHEGPVEAIADSFGHMLAWADERGIELDSLKIDVGYTLEGDGTEHDLYVALAEPTHILENQEHRS